MKSRILEALILVILIILAGCSSDPEMPILDNPGQNANNSSLDSLPVIAFDGTSATGLLGAYTLNISSDEPYAELTPMRTPALGESFIVSGKAFFTVSPCTNCLKISNIALDMDGNIVLGLLLKHPFPKGDVLKPPSAINRLDLDVFDPSLLVDPRDTDPTLYPITGVETYPGIVVNTDGYSMELAEVTGNQAVLPYKICYVNENNNRFEMGTDYQPFEVVFSPGPEMDFNLYLTMGYGASAKKAQRLIPTYYVPEFNKKAAWKVVVIPPEGDDPPGFGNTWDETDTTTEFTVTIDIYDWNHGATIAADFPDSNNTDHISASSDIGTVTVEIPGMTSSIVNATTVDTDTNGWDDPITYTALIANENGLTEGEYPSLVKVTDTRVPGIVILGGDPDTLVHTEDGIALQWLNIPEFATYQVFIATVVNIPCEPPVPTDIDPDVFTIATGFYDNVTIYGNNFTGSGGVTQVYLDNSVTQIYADDINVLSDAELTCDFDISSADEGLYDVVVFTACEGRADDMAEIVAWPSEWACFQYNSYNYGQNPNPQAFDYTNYSQRWYTASSGLKYAGPAITENYVYVTMNSSYYSSSSSHRIACYNMDTGAIEWQNYINPTGDYGRAHTSPCWFDDGGDGRVVVGGDRLWCFDAITGATEWEYATDYYFIGTSPKVVDGYVYISGYIRYTAGSGVIHCVDAMTGLEEWKSESNTGASETTIAVANGKVYAGFGMTIGNVNKYTCIDASDGSTIWQNTETAGTSHWNAPLVIDDRVYYSSYHQLLTCLDADNGDMLWQYTESSNSPWVSSVANWVDPSDGKRVIYVTGAFTSGGLWAIKDQGTYGERIWRSSAFYCDSSPVYNDGIVYAGDVYNYRVYGFDCETGTQVFNQLLSGNVRGAVGFAFDKMIATSSNGVYCFE